MAFRPFTDQELQAVPEATPSSGFRPFTDAELAQRAIAEKQAAQAPLLARSGEATGTQDFSTQIPIYSLINAPAALSEGLNTGQKAFGNGMAGTSLGALIGATQAAGTLLSPLSEGLKYVTQVGGNAIPAALAGEGQLALNSLRGTAPVRPSIAGIPIQPGFANTESEDVNTGLNTLSDIFSQFAQDPMNAGFMAAGLGAPKVVGAIGKAPAMVKSAALSPYTVPKAIISEVGNIKGRMQPATVSQSAEAAFGFNPDEVSYHVPIIKQRVLEQVGTTPKTAPEALASMDKAENNLYNERKNVNYVATGRGLVLKGDLAVQAAKDFLDPLTTIEAPEKTAILDKLQRKYGGDRSTDFGQKAQEDLNHKFSAGFENKTIDRADPAYQAERAIRDSYANQMDDISRIVTGKVETPYADIGSLIEAKAALADKLEALYQTAANQKTGLNTPPPKIPLSTAQAKYQFLKSSKNPLVKTQLEKLDENVRRVFEESPSQPPSFNLDEVIRQSLQSQAQPAPIPTSAPTVGPLIQELPANAQGYTPAFQQQILDAIAQGATKPASKKAVAQFKQ